MAKRMDVSQKDCAFEVPHEVLEQIEHAQGTRPLIAEEDVCDLKYVDVTGKIYCKVKRLLDFTIALVGLSVLLIPLLLISLLVYIDDPGKVIFSQYRVGRGGKRFKLYKFRTMKMETPKYMATMDLNDPDRYITRVGHFMRKTSLDEIPQLFNVLKGDMSMVGPRPLISDEYEIHTMRTRFGVYNIRPGVTGLAQINGRDTVSPSEKVHWDVKYLENFSLSQDLGILFGTLPRIFAGDGVAEGYGKTEWKNKMENGAPERQGH